VPTLRRNDTVVMDNYAAHEVAGIQESIERQACCAMPPGAQLASSTEPFARSCRSLVVENATSGIPAMFPYEREPL
jgi:hypothetical protein